MGIRKSTYIAIVIAALCGNLVRLQAEGPPVFEVDTCDNVFEFWKDLCLQGKCRPRTDGGCTKPSASGVCTTRAGCMQGDLESAKSLALSPKRPEQLGPYDVPEPEIPDPRYLNLVYPASGDAFDVGTAVEIRFHVEVVMAKESFDKLLAEAENANSVDGTFLLPDLGFGAYAVIQVDGEEALVLGQDGGLEAQLLEPAADAFPPADAPPNVAHAAVFSVTAALPRLPPGAHTLHVDVRGGMQGPPPPAHAWIMVGKDAGAGVEAMMERVLALEEEVAYLRAAADRSAARQSAIEEKRGRAPKHLVIELGANDGSWIQNFCERNPHFEPHIFEPQPRYAARLAAIAAKFNGRHNPKAVWTEGRKKLTFHAHTDEGGVGSSLFEAHAYGKCGSRVCEEDFSETYEVETVDFAAYLRSIALPHDVIILRMDIEGAEYEVARRMVTDGVACWVDFWEFEAHAMYSPGTAKFRPVDAVLPWLLQDCGVKMIVQDWYTEDWKVYAAWNATDPCKQCPLPNIADEP